MAYPLVKYNASTGSDTAPSDLVGSGSSASGTGSATSIDLGGTFDLSGANDDDSDYIYVATPAGDRHLFQVTAFTGGKGTCTAVDVATAIDSTFSAANWYVNGTRKTFELDSTNSDEKDWEPGWEIELASGTYTHSSHFQPGLGADFNAQFPGIEIRAEAGAATRPIIAPSGNFKRLVGGDNNILKFIGIEFGGSAAGYNGYIDAGIGVILTLVDCVLDTSSQGTQPTDLFSFQYGNRALVAVGCYFKGGTRSVVYSNANNLIKLISCHIDGDGGSFNSDAGVNLSNQNQPNVVIVDCLIRGCGGDGIGARTAGNSASLTILNNTLVDNLGCGLQFDDEGTQSDTSPIKDAIIMNNISAFNGTYGFKTPSTVSGRWQMEESSIWAGNATFSNTSGAYDGQITSSVSGVTLTADPFTDRAGGDYSLNSTSGGGADCTDAAFPSAIPTP